MVKYNNNNGKTRKKKASYANGRRFGQYTKLASMGKLSVGLIDKLYKPIDASNRFINLALQTVSEDCQSRQFLLESKTGLRKMSTLLKRLNNYAKKMEKELYEVSQNHR